MKEKMKEVWDCLNRICTLDLYKYTFILSFKDSYKQLLILHIALYHFMEVLCLIFMHLYGGLTNEAKPHMQGIQMQH